jgi:uncharacterized protein (TIGR03435 family)
VNFFCGSDLNEMRVISLIGSLVLIIGASFAQSSGDQLAFDAASVKRSNSESSGSANYCRGGPGTSDPGLLTCTNSALAQLITEAYSIKFYELVSPEWMLQGGGTEGYDVTAKIPAGTTREQYRLMLQRLLKERFHLAVHHETRGLSGYALLLGKGGPKLTSAATTPTPGARFAMTYVDAHIRVSFPHSPIASFASFLTTQLNAPVADETGLRGDYDIALDFMPTDQWRAMVSWPATAATEADPVPIIFLAIEEQLGLKLEKRKVPAAVLVVDHADKSPVEN